MLQAFTVRTNITTRVAKGKKRHVHVCYFSLDGPPQRLPPRGVAGLLHRFSMKHMASVYKRPSEMQGGPDQDEEEVLL